MKVIDGRRVAYESDEEFYLRQALRSEPADKNRVIKSRISEALRFLMFGGKLKNTVPPAERDNPNFASDVKFLDIGCADGWSLVYLGKGCPCGFTIIHPKKKFFNTCGIEMIQEVAEYGKRKGLNIIQGDIRRLVIEENAFDIIYTRHCIEHIDDPLLAIKNIAKMLKPKGTFLVIVPWEQIDLNPEKSVHSYQFRNDDDLVKLVTNAGLKVTNSFVRSGYTYRKRKYWYRLWLRRRYMGPELWVFATK
jgi:SAM-dependent methyltransferase